MNCRRLCRRAVIVLSAVLLMVGCGVLRQDAEIPTDAAPAGAVLPSEIPATTAPPTAIPPAEALTYQVVSVSPANLQVEIPEIWVSEGEGAVWAPVSGDARRVGVSRANLPPPEEAEAVLLPIIVCLDGFLVSWIVMLLRRRWAPAGNTRWKSMRGRRREMMPKRTWHPLRCTF